MNNFLKTINLKQTLIIFLLTVLMVFLVATGVQLELLFRSEKKINFEELNVKNLLNFCTIEQLEKRIQQNPKDSVANIKLAGIYENLGDHKKANYYYKEALRISKRSNYSLYSYAIFLAKNGFINFSTSLAEEIDGGKNLKCFEYKSKIYELIGDNLTKNKEYEASNKAYQVSYKYAKNVNDKKYLNRVEEKYALSYLHLADLEIENKNPKEAIFLIRNSFKIQKTALGAYKLALLLLEDNPQESQRLINYTLSKNQYIINPYLYDKLLKELYDKANQENNDSKINLYANQMKKFKKVLTTSYLFKDDLEIENTSIRPEKKKFLRKPMQKLFFDIKNNTLDDIDNLTIKAKITISDKEYETQGKVVNKINPLFHNSKIAEANLDLPKNFEQINQKQANRVIISFYGKKDKKAPCTLISIKQIIF